MRSADLLRRSALLYEGLHQLTEEIKETAGQQCCSRQGTYPGKSNVADCRKLQSTFIGSHCSSNSRTEHMRCTDWQTEVICGKDGCHGYKFRRSTLRISEVF